MIEIEEESGRDKASVEKIFNTYWKDSEMVVDSVLKNRESKFMIYLMLAPPPSNRGQYLNGFQKEVRREYLAYTGNSLFGNIGGYMGLCVGFSLTGLVTWIFDILPKCQKFVMQMKC